MTWTTLGLPQRFGPTVSCMPHHPKPARCLVVLPHHQLLCLRKKKNVTINTPVYYYGDATATATPSVKVLPQRGDPTTNCEMGNLEERTKFHPPLTGLFELTCFLHALPILGYLDAKPQARSSSLLAPSQKESHGSTGPWVCAASLLLHTRKRSRETTKRLQCAIKNIL